MKITRKIIKLAVSLIFISIMIFTVSYILTDSTKGIEDDIFGNSFDLAFSLAIIILLLVIELDLWNIVLSFLGDKAKSKLLIRANILSLILLILNIVFIVWCAADFTVFKKTLLIIFLVTYILMFILKSIYYVLFKLDW